MKKLILLALAFGAGAAIAQPTIDQKLPAGSVTDAMASLANKPSAYVAAATTVTTLSGLPTIDGATMTRAGIVLLTNQCQFTASISGTVMTVSALLGPSGSCAIAAGDTINGAATGQTVASRGTGTGGTGTYNVSVSQTLASTTLSDPASPQNGPWSVPASGAWTRPSWYPSGGTTQAFVDETMLIRGGNTYQGSSFKLATPVSGTITIDTTPTSWTQTPLQLGGIAPLSPGTVAGCQYSSSASCIGAVPSSVMRVFDATAYGAKCDGSTNDTTAIQAAITAAQTAAATSPNPQTLVGLPPGNCIVSSASLAISANNVSLKGAGMYSTTLTAPNSSSSNFDMLNLSGAGYASISDLSIKSFYASNANYGINNVTGAQMLIENVQIGGFQNGINASGGDFTGLNLFIAVPASSSAIGVNFSGTGEVFRLSHSIITGTGSGSAPAACVKITGGAAYDLVANELEHCAYSLLVQPPASGSVYSIHSTGNWYDTSTSDGVLLDGSASGALVNRSSFVGDWFSSSSAGSGLEIKGVAKGVQVSNAQIFLNAADGINVDSGASIDGLVVTGSLIADNTTAGIATNGVSGGTLVGNTIGTAAGLSGNGTGIILGSGSGSWTITGNNLAGNTTILTNSSGSATNTILNNNGYSLPVFTVAVTGTGCTVSTGTGIATAGYFTATAGGTCTYTATFGAGTKQGPVGYTVCSATDQTKVLNLTQTTSTSTSCSFTGATTSGDVIIWGVVAQY